VVAALLAVVLSAAATASAHTGPLVTVAPNQALPGEQVTVTVGGVAVTDTELRWGTVDGPLLAVAAAPGLRATITVPGDAPADVVYIRAVQNGQLVASGPIEVLAPAPSPAVSGVPADAGQAPATAAPDSVAAGSPPAAARPAASSNAGVRPKPASTPSPVASAAPDRRRVSAPKRTVPEPVPARHRTRDEPSATRATRSTGTGSAGTAVRDTRRTPVTRAATTRAAAADPTAARSDNRPAPARPAVVRRPDTPTVRQTGSAVPRPHADDAGRRLAIGVAMLALGLVASFGSFAVADVRRRRARVRT
jgi:hypothetical protein